MKKIIKIPHGFVGRIFLHNKSYKRLNGSIHPAFWFENPSLTTSGQDAIMIEIIPEKEKYNRKFLDGKEVFF